MAGVRGMRLNGGRRWLAGGVAWCLLGASAVPVAGADGGLETSLTYDKRSTRFVAAPVETICDRLVPGATATDDGAGCRYPPGQLTFLDQLGFSGSVDGFSATDSSGDMRVFEESRIADDQRVDALGVEWALIDADAALLDAAASTDGAVVGDAYDPSPGPRAAFFVHLTESAAADTLALNTNSYLDDDVTNDMVRSLDPSRPNGGGDTNVSAGWSYLDGPERADAIGVWSQAMEDLIPADLVVGPSEDPPGVWAIIGREHLGDVFSTIVLTRPDGQALLIDRVEGGGGPFTSFPLDGITQAYFDGFTMDGTAMVPGQDFQLVFHTPYARLFEGGQAIVGYLMDSQVDSFGTDLEVTDATVSLGLSLPTGATGLAGIDLEPKAGAKVKVDGRKKPIALKSWLKGDQLDEINDALNELLTLSMPSRFELQEGQPVSLGAPPG